MKWTIENLLEEKRRLIKQGLIGFYESFEITEIIGYQKNKTPINFFTLIVAEPELPPNEPSETVALNEKRIEIKGSEYKFGIFRSRVSINYVIEVIEEFNKTGEWKIGEKPICVGKLEAVVPQFVHADFNEPHPWNGVLKNNFYDGSHILELFDTTKESVRFLLKDSRILSELSRKISTVIPLNIDGLSDRLGNVVIQLPVTVISTGARGSTNGDINIQVAWHEKAVPRPLRITCEIYEDSTIDALDSKTIGVPPLKPDDTVFKLRSPVGGARTYVWDDENKVILSASPVQTFVLRLGISQRIIGLGVPEDIKREFTIPTKDGTSSFEKVELKYIPETQFFGSSAERPREPWRSERIFKLSSRHLMDSKEFVQYGKFTGLGREEALSDIRWLLEKHGSLGAWLWDPFLDAKDLLQTLFFNPHRSSDLRALSNGNTPETPEGDEEDADVEQHASMAISGSEGAQLKHEIDSSHVWKNEQYDLLNAHSGNQEGLRLDFRMRRKGSGWKFHDRFLIFPQNNGRALAWSLGTSVNSLGSSHHILQKVSNGELVQNAFLDLWDNLESEYYSVWKTKNEQ